MSPNLSNTEGNAIGPGDDPSPPFERMVNVVERKRQLEWDGLTPQPPDYFRNTFAH